MALKRIDWIMWMSLSLGFFCVCVLNYNFSNTSAHICKCTSSLTTFIHSQYWCCCCCVFARFPRMFVFIFAYMQTYSTRHTKKNTFGHFLAIHFLFIILMHYNHIYYLSVSSESDPWMGRDVECVFETGEFDHQPEWVYCWPKPTHNDTHTFSLDSANCDKRIRI